MMKLLKYSLPVYTKYKNIFAASRMSYVRNKSITMNNFTQISHFQTFVMRTACSQTALKVLQFPK